MPEFEKFLYPEACREVDEGGPDAFDIQGHPFKKGLVPGDVGNIILKKFGDSEKIPLERVVEIV